MYLQRTIDYHKNSTINKFVFMSYTVFCTATKSSRIRISHVTMTRRMILFWAVMYGDRAEVISFNLHMISTSNLS